jgi:hypothetical protein
VNPGGAYLDVIFEDLGKGRDEAIYESALVTARELQLRDAALRRFSLLVCRLILARAGAPKSVLHPNSIPF